MFWPTNAMFFDVYPLRIGKKRVFALQTRFSANGNSAFLRVDFGGFGGKRKFFQKKAGH
jgi:hypothetical protein